MCSFCNSEKETLLHLFVECRYVTDIRLKLKTWLVTYGYLHLGLIKTDIIFAVEYTDHIVNVCILVAHFVIYRCKLGNKLPTFPTVKAYIRYIKQIEHYIAYTNNNEDRFHGKLSSLIHSL
jgi:hypothetical protein